MARRNDKVTVTHAKIIVWAIQQQEAQRKVEEERLNRLEQTDADPALKANLADSLRKSIDQYDQVIKILHQMFEFETGNAF